MVALGISISLDELAVGFSIDSRHESVRCPEPGVAAMSFSHAR